MRSENFWLLDAMLISARLMLTYEGAWIPHDRCRHRRLYLRMRHYWNKRRRSNRTRYMIGGLGKFTDFSGSAVKVRLYQQAAEFCLSEVA